MTLYGLKTCDTCRSARKALKDIDFVDVRDDGVPPAVLDAALAQFGKALVNTRSTTWRGLDEAERARPERDLLLAHPTLMKRPLIVEGETMYLGWGKDVQAALAV
jgi:arsenate reductase